MELIPIFFKTLIGTIGCFLFALILKAIFFNKNKLPFISKIRLIKHILFKSENVIYIEISKFDLECFLRDYKYNFDTMSTLNRYCEMQILKDIVNEINESDLVLEKALFMAKIDEQTKEVTND